MPFPQFDRMKLALQPLAARPNKVCIDHDALVPAAPLRHETAALTAYAGKVAARIRMARETGRPVMMAFGAHTIKNGLGPVLIRLLEEGWLTHLATNGAGIIHDWELAFQGQTSEDVRANVSNGQFGLWQETGFHLNLALILGAYNDLGYGEAVGRLIEDEKHAVPTRHELQDCLSQASQSVAAAEKAAAAADLLRTLQQFELQQGAMDVPHPWKSYSVQAAAYRLRVPFTGHPMIGHDIIYVHPLNNCAAIGRAAERDFLAYADSVARLDGGVYLSIGSAVMSPMIFEKSLSMAQNLALQQGDRIQNHAIFVVDLAKSSWDWSRGEPPENSPDYYLRYCKTFSRMGGTMDYLSADNRDFLLALCRQLEVK